MVSSVEEVVKKFGGNFSIVPTSNPKVLVKSSTSQIIHLTMYGLPIDEKILGDLIGKSTPIVKSMIKQLSYRLAQCDAEIRSLKKSLK